MTRRISFTLFALGLFVLFCAGPALMPFSAHALMQEDDTEEIYEALGLIRDGDVDAGVDMLRRIGEMGNPEAFFHLAEIHRIGAGKEAAPPVAMMYYRLAAQAGSKRAALNLANILFFEGGGSRAELDEALAIWQQYATLGDVESIYLLGMVYWNGEGGQVPDPIRAYGLIWRASEAGYELAQQAEPAMREQLNDKAIEAAKEYAMAFEVRGFDGKPLDLDLVTDQVPDLPDPVEKTKKPPNWEKVWRLEVGFAMGREDTEALEKEILSKKAGTVGELFHEIIEAPNRPGLYRLLFGPISGMQDAVTRCVSLKRSGYDCFAKPPN